MVLTRWDPFREMRRMHEEMNRPWLGFFPTFEHPEEEIWTIPLDVFEEAENIIVHASMPGVDPEDIDVTVEENVLTIKGNTKMEYEREDGNYRMRERRYGTFHRTLRLPNTVDTEKVLTRYAHGVLTITLPKLESKKARHLKVKVEALEGGKT